SIEYVIARGSRFKLVHIEIAGNKYFDDETLRESMFIEPASFYLRRGRYSQAFLKKDEENLANLHRANGFRDVKVTEETMEKYKGKADQVGVALRIQEGAQRNVESVTLEGFSDEARKVIEPQLASSDGQPFSEVSLATDRNLAL